MSVTAGRSARKIREGVWSSVWDQVMVCDMVGERIGRRGGDSSMDVIGRMIAFSCECKHMLNRGLMCREKKILTLSCGILTEADSMRQLIVTAVAVFVAGVDRSFRCKIPPCAMCNFRFASISFSCCRFPACSRNLS